MALLEPFRGERVVRLADTDAARVVYFARPFEWFHELYEDWLASVHLALGDHLPEDELLLPIVHAQVTHEQPLRLGDRVELELDVRRVGTTSYTLGYRALRAQAPCVAATTTHVCLRLETGKPDPLPSDLRQALATLPLEGASS